VSGHRHERRGRHEPLVITIRTPQANLTLARPHAVLIRQALEDAESYRRLRADAWCAACQAAPQGACDDHANDLTLADAYRDLAAELAAVLPAPQDGAQ
jgi:hypothetical protein